MPLTSSVCIVALWIGNTSAGFAHTNEQRRSVARWYVSFSAVLNARVMA